MKPVPSLKGFSFPEIKSVPVLGRYQREKGEKPLSFLFPLAMDTFCANLEFDLKTIYSIIFV